MAGDVHIHHGESTGNVLHYRTPICSQCQGLNKSLKDGSKITHCLAWRGGKTIPQKSCMCCKRRKMRCDWPEEEALWETKEEAEAAGGPPRIVGRLKMTQAGVAAGAARPRKPTSSKPPTSKATKPGKAPEAEEPSKAVTVVKRKRKAEDVEEGPSKKKSKGKKVISPEFSKFHLLPCKT